jgi:transcriptional regulator with XRE-family HTH domain
MFAERLKKIRNEKGVNQITLAQWLGVTQGTIGNWETGKREPGYATLEKLAGYFGVTPDYLLGHDSEVALLARKLAGVPDADREALISNFADSIDTYFASLS